MCVKQLLTVNEHGYFYVFKNILGLLLSLVFVLKTLMNSNMFELQCVPLR